MFKWLMTLFGGGTNDYLEYQKQMHKQELEREEQNHRHRMELLKYVSLGNNPTETTHGEESVSTD